MEEILGAVHRRLWTVDCGASLLYRLEGSQDSEMVRGVEPFRRGLIAGDAAGFQLPERVFQEKKIDSSVRQMNGVGLNKRVLIVPCGFGRVGAMGAEQIHEAFSQNVPNRRVRRGRVEITA